jgi:DNA replication protein DnaC
MQRLQRKSGDSLDEFGSELGRAASQTLLNFQVDFDNVENKILKACREASELFAEALKGWLVIYGRSGSGKSHLSAAVHNHVAAQGIPAIYITVPDLLYKLRRTFNRDSRDGASEFEDLLDIYRKSPVLLLDDLGAEKSSEWATETLFSIIDYRYRLQLPTMITTNLNPYDHKSFDIRLVTRMTDKELCHVLENAAPNFRSREPLSDE